MPEARVGKAVHAALEQVLLGAPLFDAVEEARKNLRTPLEEARFDAIRPGVELFVERVDGFRRRRRVRRQMVEVPLAIREDATSTTFYAGDAYFRGILDAVFVFDDDQLAVIDHKTGQRSQSHTIVEQLEGYAVLASAYFRQVSRVWLGIYWISPTFLEWSEPVQVEQVQSELLPHVLDNIEAAALAVDDGPRVNPGVWCERCNYRTICPQGQEIRFEPVDDQMDDESEPWM